MSRSFGAGSPLYFRCARCRTRHKIDRAIGLKYEATGRTRYQRPGRGHAPGTRHDSSTAYEYRCEDCGHVGWSRHNDVRRKFERLPKEPAP